jgi:hypothetical protein
LGSPAFTVPKEGLLACRLLALTSSALYGGGFTTVCPPVQPVNLGISITTYTREDAVKKMVARLTRAVQSHPRYSDSISLTVVDNGQTLTSDDVSGASLIPNRNLGGAGGFMRGLIHYQDEGLVTHVLFMDDDASCETESIFRSAAFLEHSRSAAAAVTGGMLYENVQFQQWENGAWFDYGCHPLHFNLDLRQVENLLKNEGEDKEYTGGKGIYGAWWFFMFPVGQITTYVPPYFVRGDDVSFSYSNDFDIIRLNGVSCWQEDFKIKASPVTHYLDFRSHIMHHLLLNKLSHSTKGITSMVWRYCSEYNNSYFYDSAHAIIQAFNDILEGPDYWLDNLDMQKKRTELAKRYTLEVLQPAPEIKPDVKLADKNLAHFLFGKALCSFSASGHLLPGFILSKKRLWYLSKYHTPNVGLTFLREQIYIEDPVTEEFFILRMNRKKYFINIFFLLLTSIKFILLSKYLQQEYRKFFTIFTTNVFWKAAFSGKERENNIILKRNKYRKIVRFFKQLSVVGSKFEKLRGQAS